MPVIYARSTASGDGYTAVYSLQGPLVLAPDGPGLPALRKAVQGAVRSAGQSAKRRAIQAYSPPVIKAGWDLTTRTTPDIAIIVANTAPLAKWVEDPTRPHDIPGAFGFKVPFGIGGRFDGKFHPGTPGKHRLPGLLDQLATNFEAQIERRVTPLLQGVAGAEDLA